MSGFKGTPGPWQFEDNGSAYSIRDAEGRCIAWTTAARAAIAKATGAAP